MQVPLFGDRSDFSHHCSCQPLIARFLICRTLLLHSAVQHYVFMIPQFSSPSSLGNKCRQQVIVYSNCLEPLTHHASSIVTLIRTNALLEFATWSIWADNSRMEPPTLKSIKTQHYKNNSSNAYTKLSGTNCSVQRNLCSMRSF